MLQQLSPPMRKAPQLQLVFDLSKTVQQTQPPVALDLSQQSISQPCSPSFQMLILHCQQQGQ
jgi:hypothetical protein